MRSKMTTASNGEFWEGDFMKASSDLPKLWKVKRDVYRNRNFKNAKPFWVQNPEIPETRFFPQKDASHFVA